MSGTIVIYGGAGAIGSATARRLAATGEALHLVGRNEEKVTALAEELEATYTIGDVTDLELFDRVAEEAEGPWDGLLYAVGTINLRSLRRLEEEDFLNDFRINAVGAALAVKAGLRSLKQSERRASIVLFSTVASQQGFTFHTSMGMAKGAVDGLTLALAAELAPQIRVNAIAPSIVRTPLAEGILSSEQMAESIANLHALGRLGEADDVASVAALLLSEESDWITGQIIGVDGGRSTLRTRS